MPNKNEILRQIESLRAALADCDCGDESPVVANAREYSFISGIGGIPSGVEVKQGMAYGNPAGFRTKDDAKKYAEAFQTLLLLRAQEGVVPMEHGTRQYLIEARGDGSRLEIRHRRDGGVKQSRCFSPAFEEMESAQEAIENIGADRILKAMKTLAWA